MERSPPRGGFRKLAMWRTFFMISLAVAHRKIQVVEASSTVGTRNTRQHSDGDLVILEEDGAVELRPTSPVHGASSSSSNSNGENRHNNSKQLSNDESDDLIIVVTVDGTMAGVSKETGRVLWKQNGLTQDASSDKTEQEIAATSPSSSKGVLKPLLSTTSTARSAASSEYVAIPSVDGNVYLTADDNSVSFSASVKELVSRAPYLDPQGRVFLGSRHATATAIDKETGEILSVVATNNSGAPEPNKLQDRPVVWVGRVDYSVTVQDTRTGSREVEFSVAEVMSVADMMLPGMPVKEESTWQSSTAACNGEKQHNSNEFLPSWLGQRSLPSSSHETKDVYEGSHVHRPEEGKLRNDDPSPLATNKDPAGTTTTGTTSLVSNSNGNLVLRNEETGQVQWVANEAFDTAIAFAMETSSGQAICVDIMADLPIPSKIGDLEYLTREMERQYDLIAASNDDGDINSEKGDANTVVGALLGSGELYALPLGSRRKQRALARGSMSTAASIHQHHQASVAATEIAKHNAVPHLGGSPVGGRVKASLHPHHHLTDSESLVSSRHCDEKSPHFPSCLVDHKSHQPPHWAHSAAQTHEPKPIGSGTIQLDTALETPHLEDVSIAKISHHDWHHSSKGGWGKHRQYPNKREDLQEYSERRRDRVSDAFRPWMPVFAMVLLLSLGFLHLKKKEELAKYAKWKLQTSSDMGEGSKEPKAATITVVDQPDQVSGPVIQVSNDVLGYGGQGTVVYKGSVDGRQVAVKRMLQAYHASADREIRLLIESDGHPNVVRYFLKEARGDFVYLALELCDLSLHDLIGVLRDRMLQAPAIAERNSVLPATKSVLHQISSGVQHLHSLRIVHRDLKPANILLGAINKGSRKLPKTVESVMDLFAKGSYVAKISDMGLGKQILGQSSMGGSTLGHSSLQASRGCASSVGVGPGSVGWQAPEVMAQRVAATDVSIHSGGSNNTIGPGSGVLAGDSATPTPRTSRSVDIFSLGCIFYSTLVPGCHPYGEWYEREANIIHDRLKIDALREVSEDAFDLVRAMLDRNPKLRPTAKSICEHPFFWSSQRKLSFLCEFSDRLEIDPGTCSGIQQIDTLEIERGAAAVICTSWDRKLDERLVDDMQRFRTYDTSSVRDLLRLMRNKHHHFDELPEEFRESKCSDQVALLEYFEGAFPSLLIHCFRCCKKVLGPDDPLAIKFAIPTLGTPEDSCHLPAAESCLWPSESDSTVDKSDASVSLASTTDITAMDGDSADAATTASNGRQEGDVILSSPTEMEAANGTPSATENSDIIVWEGSTAAKSLNCRGWNRWEDDWTRSVDSRKIDPNLKRATEDSKFRTRLCNHWDETNGTNCPMRKKNKCVFAHGPVELRVKETKKNRWGKLVDENGNSSNPRQSGGEDTYGAARSIETNRKVAGKWNTRKTQGPGRGKKQSFAIKEAVEKFGPKSIPVPVSPLYKLFFRQFIGFLPLLIELAAITSLAVKDYVDFEIIAGILFINAVLGFREEYHAKKSLDEVSNSIEREVTVRRNGESQTISATQIVLGDIVLLVGGTVVPADTQWLRGDKMKIDTASLTDEPLPRDYPRSEYGDRILSDGPGEAIESDEVLPMKKDETEASKCTSKQLRYKVHRESAVPNACDLDHSVVVAQHDSIFEGFWSGDYALSDGFVGRNGSGHMRTLSSTMKVGTPNAVTRNRPSRMTQSTPTPSIT